MGRQKKKIPGNKLTGTPLRVAQDMVAKSKSPFCDDKTLVGWIATALSDAAENAKKKEHDRIERYIGESNAAGVEAMIKLCRFKRGKSS